MIRDEGPSLLQDCDMQLSVNNRSEGLRKNLEKTKSLNQSKHSSTKRQLLMRRSFYNVKGDSQFDNELLSMKTIVAEEFETQEKPGCRAKFCSPQCWSRLGVHMRHSSLFIFHDKNNKLRQMCLKLLTPAPKVTKKPSVDFAVTDKSATDKGSLKRAKTGKQDSSKINNETAKRRTSSVKISKSTSMRSSKRNLSRRKTRRN